MEGLHTKRIKVILPVAFVVALLGPSTIGLAITSDANESNAYILETRARDALVAFVNEAKDLVLEQGRDKAIEVFNDPTGVFVREGHYITFFLFQFIFF